MTNQSSEREDDVRRFIAFNFPLGGDAENLGSGDSLLEAGILDSTGILELIGFLESEFEIEIPDADLLPENFDSVGGIVSYLDRRLQA